jgi:uncharacterized membrane protein (DUF2068 family)
VPGRNGFGEVAHEIARKPNPLRIAVLVANFGILVYLIVRLVQERRTPDNSMA